MNCRRVERRLSHYLEGRLPYGEAGAIAIHLRDCSSCRRFRDDILAAEAELRAPAEPLPPAGIERRAVSLWIAQREALRWGRERALHAAVRATALLLTVLSLTVILASPSFG